MIVPVALLAGMASALQMAAGIFEKADAAPKAPAVNFKNLRRGIRWSFFIYARSQSQSMFHWGGFDQALGCYILLNFRALLSKVLRIVRASLPLKLKAGASPPEEEEHLPAAVPTGCFPCQKKCQANLRVCRFSSMLPV